MRVEYKMSDGIVSFSESELILMFIQFCRFHRDNYSDMTIKVCCAYKTVFESKI